MLEKVRKHEKNEADLFASVPGSQPNKKNMQTHDDMNITVRKYQ